VAEERIRTHWYPAILTDPETGEERSLWPAKWSMEYMGKIRHTRAFRSQMLNDPAAYDGDYWVDTDFIYDDIPTTHQLLSIDPAVTSKKKSDFTALAVIGYSQMKDMCVVKDAWALKIRPGKLLRERVIAILDMYPETSGIVIETNQGGDTWLAILHDMPCPVNTVSQSAPKEVRAGSLLAKYQRGKVVHAKRLPALEGQMVSFPKGANDDLVDATGTGVTVFLKGDKKPRQVQARSASYM
jgi:phage terminase large subunit-like protein